jgi:MFS family permease
MELIMGLRTSPHKWTLMTLYLATMIMRASFYVTIAVISSSLYMSGALVGWGVAIVLVIYPVAELTTVSFFGSYGDKIGRKPIFVFSMLVTATAAFLFGFSITPEIAFIIAALFGIGAASEVTTTLSMIADRSSEYNRARLMSYYNLSTLMGLAGGYGLGIILLQFEFVPTLILLAAGSACVVSGVIAFFMIKETHVKDHEDKSVFTLLKEVAGDRRIQLLLPVYIPIISLYGLVISKAQHIIEEYFNITEWDFLMLFGMLGAALFLGIIVMGHLSDHFMKRRPFIATGLIGFGLLAFILVANAESFEQLWSIWPLLPTLGFIAGSFPPAAMAYLTDISEKESRGSTMGVYSIFFGSGMIIGPLAGELMYQQFGLYLGLGVLLALIIGVACIGTYFLPETEINADTGSETT